MKVALLSKIVFACFAIGLCLTTAQAQDSQAQAPRIARKPGAALEASATKRVQPAYPPLARAAQVKGSVVVEVTIDEEGNVIAARAVSGHPLLKDATVAAARAWKFTPSTVEGRAVKVIGTLTFNFGRDNSKEIELLNQRIANDPSSAELRYQLGLRYLENGEPDKAIEPFKQAVSLAPKLAKAHVGLGDAYWRSSHTELAIHAYEQAARVDPDYAEAYFYLGMLYWREERYPEAIDAFDQAVKRNNQLHMAFVGMGRSYSELGRYQEAVRSFTQAAKIRPDSLDAHLELGETYLKLGDKAAAMNEYRILKGIKPFIAEQLLEKINKQK